MNTKWQIKNVDILGISQFQSEQNTRSLWYTEMLDFWKRASLWLSEKEVGLLNNVGEISIKLDFGLS